MGLSIPMALEGLMELLHGEDSSAGENDVTPSGSAFFAFLFTFFNNQMIILSRN
jgi:hypothetical protein